MSHWKTIPNNIQCLFTLFSWSNYRTYVRFCQYMHEKDTLSLGCLPFTPGMSGWRAQNPIKLWKKPNTPLPAYTVSRFKRTFWTFLKFFKISVVPHPATVLCVWDRLFREHAIHGCGHPDPWQAIYVIQPKHEPQVCFLYALYTFLGLAGQFQKLRLLYL